MFSQSCARHSRRPRVRLVQIPDSLASLQRERLPAPDSSQDRVPVERRQAAALDDVADLVFVIQARESRRPQWTGGAERVPRVVERELGLPSGSAERDAAFFHETRRDDTRRHETRRERVDANEVDATDHVGRKAFGERLEDLRQGADVSPEPHSAVGCAREVRGAGRRRFAGTRSAADARRALEAAADELGPCRIEERHRVLDRRLEHARSGTSPTSSSAASVLDARSARQRLEVRPRRT